MRCARCGRALMAAYVSDGPYSWGPKCAKAAGFTKPTGPRFEKHQPSEPDPGQLALPLVVQSPAQPGHRYRIDGVDVLAMEGGDAPMVATIAEPWLKDHRRVSSADLVALPMAYFHGAIPA